VTVYLRILHLLTIACSTMIMPLQSNIIQACNSVSLVSLECVARSRVRLERNHHPSRTCKTTTWRLLCRCVVPMRARRTTLDVNDAAWSSKKMPRKTKRSAKRQKDRYTHCIGRESNPGLAEVGLKELWQRLILPLNHRCSDWTVK
jgi:hypothetical protein